MFKKLIKVILNYLSKLTVEQEDVVGVDITPNCIRVAQLESSKKKWTLTKLGYKYIDNVVDDSIDENPEQYVNKLVQLLNSSKIKTKSAAVSIPVSTAFIKPVTLPLMTPEELKEAEDNKSLWENAVQLEDIDEYSVFSQVLKRNSAESTMELLFVASKYDAIDKYLNIIRQAGLNPVVVDVRCFATRNALELRHDLTQIDTPIVIVEFGVFENYILILHKDSPYISPIYLNEKDRLSLMEPEASEELLKKVSSRFAMQISQAISSYQSKYKVESIDSLLLSSTMPVVDRVVAYFNESMSDIEVEVFDPLMNVKIPENLKEKSTAELNSSIFSSALGLATRKLDVFGYYEYVTGTNNINLLPNRENVKNQEKMKFFSRWGVAIFVIIAIALGVWNFLVDQKEVDKVDKLMVEYNLLEGIKNEREMTLTDLNIKKNSLEGTLKATNNMTSNQSFMYSVLLGIMTAKPNAELVLTKIDYEGVDTLMVYGLSTNDPNILKLIENLKMVEVIDKASLVTMTVETISEQTLKSFTIKCTLAPQQTIDNREKD
jgi:type IV pilus assembly protein PilN